MFLCPLWHSCVWGWRYLGLLMDYATKPISTLKNGAERPMHCGQLDPEQDPKERRNRRDWRYDSTPGMVSITPCGPWQHGLGRSALPLTREGYADHP